MNFYKVSMMSNRFWKIMAKYNWMCDTTVMVLVKLDIKMQHYSFFIKY